MASWTVEFTPSSQKEFDRLDAAIKKRIGRYLTERISVDPKRYALPLTGNKKGYWRYRVGDYRLIAAIDDGLIIVTVVRIAHRKHVYD